MTTRVPLQLMITAMPIRNSVHVTCMLQDMHVTCNMHFYNYYTLPQFHYTTNSQTVLNTWTLVSLVTTTFIPQHIYKIPLSHTSLYMISIHLIYTTSSYLYPTPHYTLNHTAYPHMHISHPHSSLTTLLAYNYIFKQQHKFPTQTIYNLGTKGKHINGVNIRQYEKFCKSMCVCVWGGG